MVITKSLKIDLVDRVVLAPIHAVQCDSNTRAVAVTLTAGGVAWEPPAGAAISVAFKKPDGRKGWYDKLPDGSNACLVSGNVVTAILAPEALTVAGKVDAVIVFQDGSLNQLATFGFAILVEPNPAAGSVISNDYYNYSNMEAVNQAMEDFFAKAEAEQSAFMEKVETDQAAFLETAGEALAAVHEAATADAPAIVCEASGELIAVSDASDRLVQELKVYGKTTQDGTPSPNNPVPLVSVGDSGSIDLTVAGKNLLPYSEQSQTLSGLQIVNNQDGSWTLSGTPTVGASFLVYSLPVRKGIQYVLSGCPDGGSNTSYYMRAINSEVEVDAYDYGSGATFAPTKNGIVNIRIYFKTGKAFNNLVFYPMVEVGDARTSFEPYKPSQTLTAQTPNGLPGIPVSSGGNYTDENGQAWVCDEIDFARGVYVQRVGVKTYTNSSEFTKSPGDGNFADRFFADVSENLLAYAGLSSMHSTIDAWGTHDNAIGFGTGNSTSLFARFNGVTTLEQLNVLISASPLTVIYGKATPTEIPLSAEELAAYAALHTNKPNTTVHNDAGAHMELSYVADTKLYIDNKIAAIAAAVLNNT